MRMRKKKWAEPWIEEHRDFVYQNPVENKGKWKEITTTRHITFRDWHW